jgi:hypothetical protein
LPDFNGGMLNPDIRYLRAGEVVNGVKCAMTEFMREREGQVMTDRLETVINRRRDDEAAKRFLLLYGSEYVKESKKSIANVNLGGIRPEPWRTGNENEFNPYAINLSDLQDHISEIRDENVDPRGGGKLSGLCWPVDPTKFRHWDQKKNSCVLNSPTKNDPQSQWPSKGEELCPPQIGVTLWDYKPKENNGVFSSHCVPVPDYSRFALDKTQQATIDLTLIGSNQGTVFYDFINQAGLGPFKNIITPGNRSIGAVFPRADITAKGTTTFDVSVAMPQTIFQAIEADSPYSSEAARLPNAIKNANAPAAKMPHLTPGRTGDLTKKAPIPFYDEEFRSRQKNGGANKNPDTLTNDEIRLISDDLTPNKQLTAGCQGGVLKVDDKTEIDYLKLKEMMLNVVAQQNAQVSYLGGPEVALDTINLTSSFQIVLDMSAGTKHIFRLFPMVLPPQMGVKPDHTHTLKITLHGAKKKGSAQSGKHLVAACRQRLQPPKETAGKGGTLGANVPGNGAQFCNTPVGQLLEAVIESTEQNKSSGSSSQ